jgi:hypothetical protein
MNLIIKSSITFIIYAVFITACSSQPMLQGDSASMQKAKADKAQRELASEVSKIK